MKTICIAALAASIAATPALADEAAPATTTPEAITVIATGAPLRLDQTGQSISVVGLDELQKVAGPDLSRVLERLPGVAIARNGALGATTSLFVRGANSDQVLVLIDGVRNADYASPGGGYDLGNLLANNLQSVELLRGSNSVIWGSQAIGGVLAVTTREIAGVEASAEYGAYDTLTATTAAGIKSDRYAVSLNAGYARSDGFSAKVGSTEADGVRQWQVGGKARYELADGLTLRTVARYANSRLGVDLSSPAAPDIQFTKEGSGRVGLDYAGTGFTLTGGVALDATARRYDSPAWGASEYLGGAIRADLSGHVALPSDFALDLGGASEWSRARSTYDARQTARLSSLHALLGWYGARATLAAGVRLDDHDRFGSHWTFGTNGSVDLVDGWRLRGSYGEGFKAPTLYQLYAGYGTGNLDLHPETSRSYEAGIEKGDRNAPLHFAATVFRRDSRNLIDIDSAYHYINVARARSEGVEVELGAKPTDRFSVWANYTYLRARDLTNHRALARRPDNAVGVGADWRTPLHDLALGADLRMVSKTVDYNFLGTALPIAAHTVVTLRASLPINDKLEVFGRVENLGDERYQTAFGYNTPGRSAYAGVRVRY